MSKLFIIKRPFKLLILFFFVCCGQNKKQSDQPTHIQRELYNTFVKSKHLQPVFDKAKFDTLHGWDFGWAILEPINVAKGDEDEVQLSKRFSPGQKALYFIWYLDAQVTNGGIIQFYWNGYQRYVPPIIDGLKLIGDTSMLNLINRAEKEYLANKEKFTYQKKKDDWEPLYNDLKKFEEYDSIYYKTHDKTMELIENYIRQNSNDFVLLK